MANRWKSGKHHVSPYDFIPEVRRRIRLRGRVVFHDITLRDGEQQARMTFRKDEKIRIATALDEAAVGVEGAALSLGTAEAKKSLKVALATGCDRGVRV